MNGQYIADAVKYATSSFATERTDLEIYISPRPWGDPKQLAVLGVKVHP